MTSTPTPWLRLPLFDRREDFSVDNTHCLPSPPRPPCCAAQIEGVLDGPLYWEDAELIVRAVNNHEGLLVALKKVVDDERFRSLYIHTISAVLNAIARAEEN